MITFCDEPKTGEKAYGGTISAGTAGLLCLLTVLGSITFVVPLALFAAALALLLRPESRAWLRR